MLESERRDVTSEIRIYKLSSILWHISITKSKIDHTWEPDKIKHFFRTFFWKRAKKKYFSQQLLEQQKLLKKNDCFRKEKCC